MSKLVRYMKVFPGLHRISTVLVLLIVGASVLGAQSRRQVTQEEDRAEPEDVIVIPQPSPAPEHPEPLEPLEPLEPYEPWLEEIEWEYLQEYEMLEDEVREQMREAEEQVRRAEQQARQAEAQARRAGAQRARRYVRVSNEERKQIAQAYKAAYALILGEVWQDALTTLEAFLAQYGTNSYTDDARFWICYAMERLDYPDTELFEVYHKFIQEFENSQWTDDAKANLFKIGQRLVQKNRKNREQYGPIVDELKQDYDNEVMIHTLYVLRRIRDEQSLAAVLKLYREMKDAEMRKKIVFELRFYDFPSVIDELQEIAAKDPDPKVREVAITTLGRFSSTAVIKPLRSILKSSESPDERRAAVLALVRVDSDEIVPILLDVARNDVHVKVRTEAVSTLSRLGTPAAQEALIELLEKR
ncbi:MAG: HEAT repeat domain-containing protein [Fidelibacterota bacterium]|nr:MAG: HEAT repeat domain-containing protein [Candidatus Neomarinimicrobiota bacterium]